MHSLGAMAFCLGPSSELYQNTGEEEDFEGFRL